MKLRGGDAECGGLGDKWEASLKFCGQRIQSASPEVNVKSRGPSTHPFQRSKNPKPGNKLCVFPFPLPVQQQQQLGT